MSAAAIAYGRAHRQGWTDATLLDLTLTYIENQQDDAAFAEYLDRIAEEENA